MLKDLEQRPENSSVLIPDNIPDNRVVSDELGIPSSGIFGLIVAGLAGLVANM